MYFDMANIIDASSFCFGGTTIIVKMFSKIVQTQYRVAICSFVIVKMNLKVSKWCTEQPRILWDCENVS